MSNKVSLSDILPHLQSVREYTNYYSAKCVFHSPDNHPSLLVYKNGWFRCLSCGRTGDFYLLQRKLVGWDSRSMAIQSERTDWTPQAIRSPDMEEVCVDANRMLIDYSDSLSWYLRMRGLEDRIEPQKLGWVNGWYTIPVYNFEDDFRGMIMRAGPHIELASGQRYVTRCKDSIYVPDWYLAKTSSYVVVTFGIMDALTLTHLRIPAVSTIYGKTMRVTDLDWARKSIVFFPDQREESAAIFLCNKLGWRGKILQYDYPDNCKDPNDLYRAGYEIQMRNAIEAIR